MPGALWLVVAGLAASGELVTTWLCDTNHAFLSRAAYAESSRRGCYTEERRVALGTELPARSFTVDCDGCLLFHEGPNCTRALPTRYCNPSACQTRGGVSVSIVGAPQAPCACTPLRYLVTRIKAARNGATPCAAP